MKNQSVKKINTAGTVGYVISILLIVASIAGMVAVALGVAGAAVISKENVNVSVATDVNITTTGNIFEKLNNLVKIDGVQNLNSLADENGKTTLTEDSDISEITVNKQGNGFEINTKTNEMTFSLKKIVFALVATFIYLGAVTVMLYMLKALMKALRKCETPFSQEVIGKMTRFANSLIPVAALNIVCGGFWGAVSVGDNFSMTVNLTSVLIAAVVYLLVVVFKYGAQLQRESDETV